MTDAEKFLWQRLRLGQILSCKFRRQSPIGKYIVDFVCFEKKVIIELDGGQHSVEKQKDLSRDSWLKNQGFRVLRFWNHDVRANIEGVLERIMAELKSPHLNPPPQVGRK